MPGYVLLVDDDPYIRNVIASALQDEGCEVVTAIGGRHAIEMVTKRPPDVILLDWRMPDLDAPAFSARYHALPGPHAPLILFTAMHNAQKRATEIGAAAVVEKPFDLDQLLNVLTRYTPCVSAPE